jgi:hypothetical protein
VGGLNGEGDFVSIDYVSCTDTFKIPYVKAAIEVLKKRAGALSADQVRCLDVLGDLRLGGISATSGQPMGSPMSFPLLCLFNKTMIDLALADLLEERIISFKEFAGHKCLVNGDDALFKEIKKKGGILKALKVHASLIGCRVNEEKTMVDTYEAEINSTVFYRASRQKKTNVSSLWMSRKEADVVGYGLRSAVDFASQRRIIRANAHVLADQEDKMMYAVPCFTARKLWKDRKIRKALQTPGRCFDPVRNFFLMSPKCLMDTTSTVRKRQGF